MHRSTWGIKTQATIELQEDHYTADHQYLI